MKSLIYFWVLFIVPISLFAVTEVELPFPCNKSYVLTQGNNTNFSHNGKGKYAFDFGLPEGSVVTAVAPGKVILIREWSNEHCNPSNNPGCNAKANYVVIDHYDNTTSAYLHLKQNSVNVNVGDIVYTGQPIALSGATGRITAAHLHFQIQEKCGIWWCQSLPSRFKNVGIPATWTSPGESCSCPSGFSNYASCNGNSLKQCINGEGITKNCTNCISQPYMTHDICEGEIVSTGTIEMLYPLDGDSTDNPVNFRSRVTGDIVEVKYLADDKWNLGSSSNTDNNFSVDYEFDSTGLRHLSAKGYDSDGNYVQGSKVDFDIKILEAGSGSVNFLKPSGASSPNPVILESRVTGSIDEVKYFVENNYYLDGSSDKNNNFHYEREFTQTGNRTIYARGYKNGIEINGAYDKINVFVEEVQNCNDECYSLGDKSCDGNAIYECINGNNGCKELKYQKTCSSNQTCNDGQCISNCSDECSNINERICNDQKVYKCIKIDNGCNKLILIDTCSNSQTCENGRCSNETCEDECIKNNKKCENNNIMKCINNGICNKWIEINKCSSDETCENGECKENSCDECQNLGDKKCISLDEIVECKFDGQCKKWESVKNCTGNDTCQNGQCKNNQNCKNTCLNNRDKKCIENRVIECVSEGECNEWKETKVCKSFEKCQNGECIEPSSNCIPNTKICGSKKEIYMCSEINHIYVPYKKCESNQVCKNGECVLTNSSQEKNSSSCTYSNNSNSDKNLIILFLLTLIILITIRKQNEL